MPNWVKNKITLLNTTEDPNKITQILVDIRNNKELEEHAGIDIFTTESVEKLVEKFPTIDFDKIVPMPAELNISSGSATNNGLDWWLYVNRRDLPVEERLEPELSDDDYLKVKNYSRWGIKDVEAMFTDSEAVAKILQDGEKEDIRDIGVAAAHNIITYDAPSWYEWRYQHWGTKWNASECAGSAGPNEIRFSTAWSPAYPIAQALSAKYPGVVVSIIGADENFPEVFHNVIFLNGKEISTEEPSVPEKIWGDLWGYDDDDLKDLEEELEYEKW